MSRVLQENDAVRLNGVPPHFEAVRQVISAGSLLVEWTVHMCNLTLLATNISPTTFSQGGVCFFPRRVYGSLYMIFFGGLLLLRVVSMRKSDVFLFSLKLYSLKSRLESIP